MVMLVIFFRFLFYFLVLIVFYLFFFVLYVYEDKYSEYDVYEEENVEKIVV